MVHVPGLPGASGGWSRRSSRCSPRAAGVPMPGGHRVRRGRAAAPRARRGARAARRPELVSVRLVLTPENVVLAEARRSYTTLSLFGYRVDGVVANRVFPSEGADDWRAGWVAAQAAVLTEVAGVLRRPPDLALGLPGRPSRSGVATLTELAQRAVRRDRPARGAARATGRFRLTRSGSGTTAAPRPAVRLQRPRSISPGNGDDLVVTVGSYRRLLTLPAGLARHRIAGARVDARRAAGEVRGEDAVTRRARGPTDDRCRRWARWPRRQPSCSARCPTWARDHGADVGDGLGAAAGHAADGLRDVERAPRHRCARSAPTARSAGSCTPSGRPRPRCGPHLAVAAASLLQAAAGAARDRGARRASLGRRPGEGVEHIDLGDEWPEDGPE